MFVYFLCIFCVKNIIGLLQYSTIQLTVLAGYLGWGLNKLDLMNMLLEGNSFVCRQLTVLWMVVGVRKLRKAVLFACVLSHVWVLSTPWTRAYQAPLSMRFSRQECWSGLPCPTLRDLLNPGMEPESSASPALAGEVFYHWANWGAWVSTHGR